MLRHVEGGSAASGPNDPTGNYQLQGAPSWSRIGQEIANSTWPPAGSLAVGLEQSPSATHI